MNSLTDPILEQRWMEGGRVLSCSLPFIALPTWKYILSWGNCSNIFFRTISCIGLEKESIFEDIGHMVVSVVKSCRMGIALV